MRLINFFYFFLILIPVSCSKQEKRTPPPVYVTKAQKYRAAEKFRKTALKMKKFRKSERLFRAAKLYIESGKPDKAEKLLITVTKLKFVRYQTAARTRYLIFKIRNNLTKENLLYLMTKYPDSVTAEDCLDLYENKFELGKRESILKNLYSKLKKTNLGDNILFKLYLLNFKIYNNTKDKRYLIKATGYLKIIIKNKMYRNSSLRDDAFYNLAKSFDIMKDYKNEIRILKKFLDTRSSSFIFGEYNSEYLDDAQMMLGKVYEKTGNYKKALETYKKLPELFEYSRLRDDALMRRISINLNSGKTKNACKLMKKFIKKHKLSRYFPDIQRKKANLCEN